MNEARNVQRMRRDTQAVRVARFPHFGKWRRVLRSRVPAIRPEYGPFPCTYVTEYSK
jgi:hypothetical protein